MNKCLFCNKEIPQKNKFCCQSHAAIYNNRHREKKVKVCKYCGKEFYGYKTSRNKFCSTSCCEKSKFEKKDKDYCQGKIKNMATLKRHYLNNNEYKCAICGISEWNGKEIVLVLDHIDGNSNNNIPQNLRLVCPNCDSQLPTFKNRNNGNGRAYRRERYAEGKSY